MTMKTAMWRAISATETEKKAEFGPVQEGWHSSPSAALAAWVEPVTSMPDDTGHNPIPHDNGVEAPKRRGRPPRHA